MTIRHYYRKKLTLSALVMLLPACTIYESDGRKCIREGCSPYFSQVVFFSQGDTTCAFLTEREDHLAAHLPEFSAQRLADSTYQVQVVDQVDGVPIRCTWPSPRGNSHEAQRTRYEALKPQFSSRAF